MYYKVVSFNMKSAYVSYIGVNNSEKFAITYKLNSWVEPILSGSKLMVFDSLKNAQDFMVSWGSYIYECEVKNPSKKGIFVEGTPDIYEDINIILDLKNKKKKFSHLLQKPIKGTVFCDAVKLIGEPIV